MADGDDMWGDFSALTGKPLRSAHDPHRAPVDPRVIDTLTAQKMTRRQLLEWQSVELASIRHLLTLLLASNAETLENLRRDVNGIAFPYSSSLSRPNAKVMNTATESVSKALFPDPGA